MEKECFLFPPPSDPIRPELGPGGVTVLHGGNLPHHINLRNNMMGVPLPCTSTNLSTFCVDFLYVIEEVAIEEGFSREQTFPQDWEDKYHGQSLPFNSNNLV